MNPWLESTEYQQVLRAHRSSDRTTLNRIIAERLAAVEGLERAFWLRVRANQLARDAAVLPHVTEAAWADLEEALRISPGDPESQATTLAEAFHLCVTTERVDRLGPLIKLLHRYSQWVDPAHIFWRNMGFFHMKRRKWQLAMRDFDRAVAAFAALSPREQEIHSCHLVHFHAWRAQNLVACGRPEPAAADLETARTLAAHHAPENISHIALATAHAELALHLGQLQEARAAVQQGLTRDSDLKRPRPTPAQMAETELLAARIARAEGNDLGFRHFCEKALSICAQHRLPLTEARVQAVMAGAAR